MRKICLAALLTMVSGQALAEWLNIGGSPDSASFIEPSSIRNDGNLRKIWELQNLKQQNKETGEMSRRFLREFDCGDAQNRILSYTGYSDPMGRGKILESSENPSQWFAIPPPGHVVQIIYKFVCGKQAPSQLQGHFAPERHRYGQSNSSIA